MRVLHRCFKLIYIYIYMVDITLRKQKNRCKWKESIKKYKKEDAGYIAFPAV